MAERPNILLCYWDHHAVRIEYRCTCRSNIALRVLQSGQNYVYINPSPVYPVVNVEWDEDMINIRSTHCNVGVYFQRYQNRRVIDIHP